MGRDERVRLLKLLVSLEFSGFRRNLEPARDFATQNIDDSTLLSTF